MVCSVDRCCCLGQFPLQLRHSWSRFQCHTLSSNEYVRKCFLLLWEDHDATWTLLWSPPSHYLCSSAVAMSCYHKYREGTTPIRIFVCASHVCLCFRVSCDLSNSSRIQFIPSRVPNHIGNLRYRRLGLTLWLLFTRRRDSSLHATVSSQQQPSTRWWLFRRRSQEVWTLEELVTAHIVLCKSFADTADLICYCD